MKKHELSLVFLTFFCVVGLVALLFWKQAQNTHPMILSPLPASTQDASVPSTQGPGKLDINLATAQEFESLPGIGPVLAQRIVDYRTEHGPFQSPSQLTLVSGIGLAKLDQILDYITVGGPA